MNKSCVKPIGICLAKVVNPKDGKKYKINFTMVPNEPKLTPIIGVKAVEHIKLVTINSDSFQRDNTVDISELDEFSEVWYTPW